MSKSTSSSSTENQSIVKAIEIMTDRITHAITGSAILGLLIFLISDPQMQEYGNSILRDMQDKDGFLVFLSIMMALTLLIVYMVLGLFAFAFMYYSVTGNQTFKAATMFKTNTHVENLAETE